MQEVNMYLNLNVVTDDLYGNHKLARKLIIDE